MQNVHSSFARAEYEPEPSGRDVQGYEREADAASGPILRQYVRIRERLAPLAAVPLVPFAARCDYERYAASLPKPVLLWLLTVAAVVKSLGSIAPDAALILARRLGQKRATRWEDLADEFGSSVERLKATKRVASLRFAFECGSRGITDDIRAFGGSEHETGGPYTVEDMAELRRVRVYGFVRDLAELERIGS